MITSGTRPISPRNNDLEEDAITELAPRNPEKSETVMSNYEQPQEQHEAIRKQLCHELCNIRSHRALPRAGPPGPRDMTDVR